MVLQDVLNISTLADGPAAKEQSNRKKHGLDFRTASRVFLDSHVIEFDDPDAADELRFNAIGLVDGRMLFVTYTMRDEIVRIISARGAVPREKKEVLRDLSSIRRSRRRPTGAPSTP